MICVCQPIDLFMDEECPKTCLIRWAAESKSNLSGSEPKQ